MRNLTGVLVFSTTLLLVLGCHKNTGEAPGPADASLPTADAQGPADAVKSPLDSGPQDSGITDAQKTTDSQPPGGLGSTPHGTPDAHGSHLKADADPNEAERAALESCVDRWLKKNKLDDFGNAEGTMYAGGTPLFDERTGESRDRLKYVFDRKPEARKVCMQPSSPR